MLVPLLRAQGLNMASTRSIRKLHQMQMGVTIAVRRGIRELVDGSVMFACASDAAEYLRGISAEANGKLSAPIHGDGSGQALPEIA